MDTAIGIILGFMLGFAFMAFLAAEPSKEDRQIAICEYKGGEVQGKMCILDSVAINLDSFTKDLK